MKKLLKWIGLMLLALYVMAMFLNTQKMKQRAEIRRQQQSSAQEQLSQNPTPTPTSTPQPKLKDVEYKVVERLDSGVVENIRVLIIADDYSEDKVKDYIDEVKRDECHKQCNISVFDTQRAADLDIVYSKLSTSEETTTWKKKNYVYVGDHLIAMYYFDTESVTLFPMRDWFYYESIKDN